MSVRRAPGLLLLIPLLLLGALACPETPPPNPSPDPPRDSPDAARPGQPEPGLDAGAPTAPDPDLAVPTPPPSGGVLLDLGDFRVGFSPDGKRLAYLSRAPGAPVLLFTVVTVPQGRRITDFLLLEETDVARASRLLKEAGYQEAVAPMPAGTRLALKASEGGWAVELRVDGEVRSGSLGRHFLSALQSVAEPRPRLRGCTRDGLWAAYELRGSADAPEGWPRTVLALSLRPAPVPEPDPDPAEGTEPPHSDGGVAEP